MSPAQLTSVGVGIHNVLIATDFSRFSKVAMDFALELSQSYQAHCYVAFVVPSTEFLLAGPEAYVAAKEAARRDLLDLKAELQKTHSSMEAEDYELFMLEGDVAQSLLDFAHQKEADLIVVGTHGRSGLGKLFMGSVAERVFRQSTVPVLTIGPSLYKLPHELASRNILVPADFSAPSNRGIKYACELAQEHDAKLTLLHVLNPGDYKYDSDLKRALPEIEKKLTLSLGACARSLKFSCRIELGRVVPTITRTASEIHADLLVMGVRPWTGLLDRLMWPHAYEVVREAPCPVVTVRGAVPHHF